MPAIDVRYFDSYLAAEPRRWFRDDALLQSLISRCAGDKSAAIFEALSNLEGDVAGDFRRLADEAGRLEKHPKLRAYDAYHRRVDEVTLPAETRELLRRVYLKRPFDPARNPWEFYGSIYLLAQNGEAGLMCSLACTDGMVRLLRRFANTDTLKQMLRDLEVGGEGEFKHAAQFVTEIQGGSDAGSNAVEARAEGDCYRLSGPKWFCSNITADYFVVSARPIGAPAGPKGVALFAVPAYVNGARNGTTIDRLKNKMGTQSLPTVELSFDGALAYPVGPLDKGLANLVSIVLSTSRVHCAVNNAGMLRRVYRDAAHYAHCREAFGMAIERFALVKHSLKRIEETARRLTAGTFDMLSRQLALEEAALHPDGASDVLRKKQHALRILIMMNKVATTREASLAVHEAVSIYAGNGIEEEWSATPRLLRDSIINEVWEGPHALLTTRSLMDLEQGPLSPQEFVDEIWSLSKPEKRKDLLGALRDILATRDPDEKTVSFSTWMEEAMREFGRQAL